MNKPPNIGTQFSPHLPSFELDHNKHMKDPSIGPKYLMMTRIENMQNSSKYENSSTKKETLTNVSPFLIKKVIDSVCGEIEICKKLQSGNILLKTKNLTQAQKLIKLISLSPTIKIEVSEHKTLNQSRGVIYCNDLRNIAENEILEELKSQNVTEVKKILKKQNNNLTETTGDNNNLIETGLIIITFASISLPEFINIGYQRTRVRTFIPPPLKCKDCFRFGHLSKFCNYDKLCINCGNIDHLAENELCEKVQTCNNCKENNLPNTNHTAVSKICPIFIKHKEIQAIKTIEKVDSKTAIAKYNERHSNKNSYSTVARPQPVYDLPKQTATISEAKSNTQKNNITVSNSTTKNKQQLSATDNTSSPTKTSEVKILPINTSRRTRSQFKRAAKKPKISKEKENQESEGTDNTTMDE